MSQLTFTYDDENENEDGNINIDQNIRESQLEPEQATTPNLASYDLSKATTSGWSEMHEQPQSKGFVVMRRNKVSSQQKKFIMRFTRDKYEDIFDTIAKKFNLKPRKCQIQYGIRKADDTVETITMMYDEGDLMKNTLHMFYCTAEDMSELIVSEVSNPKRSVRPKEKKFAELKKHIVIDRKYYETCISTSIASDFIHKRNLIRVILASKNCLNLVNPTLFYCHIPGCRNPEVKLRTFNSLSDIVNHWKNHDYKKSSYRFDQCVQILLRRYNHLVDMKEKLLLEDDVDQAIYELDQNEELKIDSAGSKKMHLFDDSMVCKERQVNQNIMEKLAVGDRSVLDDLPLIPAASSFFTPGRRNKSGNARSTSGN